MSATEETGPMLARANLLRMRGQWAEAAEQCAEVLRRDPTNDTAHSLLGDIYQDQGRLEEARRWYQLALELNPASDADRGKLARIEEMLEARQQRAEWAAVIEGRAAPAATAWMVRDSVQRVAAIAGALLCALVLVMAILVSATERGGAASSEALPPAAPPMEVRRRPVALGPPADTRRERELLRRLAPVAAGRPAHLVRVEIDPREQSARLRLYMPAKAREGLTAGQLRFRLMQEAYRAAWELHREDPSLRTVDTLVVGPPAGAPASAGEAELWFAGTLAAENLVVDPQRVTVQELQTFFSGPPGVVWAPELAAP